MNRSSSSSSRVAAAVVTLVLVAVLAVAVGVVLGRGTPAAAPSDPQPSVTPSPTPEPSTPAKPTEVPTATPDGIFDVDLDNLTENRVKVRITDATGSVVDVSSGTPGDGMSVRWGDSIVQNVDADTIRIVFVGLPRDELVRLAISERDGAVHFDFVQAAPPPYSDAVGFDRILVIDFDAPVSADDVTVTFVD
jgi:hypothetical protein